MKRGGEEIYVGPVGQNSSKLIEYFEVRTENQHKQQSSLHASARRLTKSHQTEIPLFICSGN